MRGPASVRQKKGASCLFAAALAVTDESTCTQVSGSATDTSAGIGYVKQAWQGVMTCATVAKYLPDILAAATGTNSTGAYETIVGLIHDDAYEAYDASTIAEGTTRTAYVKNDEEAAPHGRCCGRP